MGHKSLAAEIIKLSVAETWDEAKLEWELLEIYKEKEPDTCLCGHYPIIENCVMRNRLNGNQTIVGNVCVKKFFGFPSDKIFQAINRIARDVTAPLNAEAIDYAAQQGWLTLWEQRFCRGLIRKRNLSHNQFMKRVQINQSVLRRVARNRPGRQVQTCSEFEAGN